MNISHHLDQTTLMRYASGDLDEAFLVVVATHLAMCAECREKVHEAEEVGGEFLRQSSDLSDVPIDGGAFEKLMASIDAVEMSDAAPAARMITAADNSDVPLPLRRYIGDSMDAVKWKSVAPGVRKYDLKPESQTGSALYMLHIAPGLAVPEHGHGGAELTMILSGAYQDSMGEFATGDIADLDEHIEHQPKVSSPEPCICLVATEQPTRFKGWLMKVIQPIIRI